MRKSEYFAANGPRITQTSADRSHQTPRNTERAALPTVIRGRAPSLNDKLARAPDEKPHEISRWQDRHFWSPRTGYVCPQTPRNPPRTKDRSQRSHKIVYPML